MEDGRRKLGTKQPRQIGVDKVANTWLSVHTEAQRGDGNA
jgi:hypothetical protein